MGNPINGLIHSLRSELSDLQEAQKASPSRALAILITEVEKLLALAIYFQ